MMKDLEEVPKGLAFHTEQLEAARLLTLRGCTTHGQTEHTCRMLLSHDLQGSSRPAMRQAGVLGSDQCHTSQEKEPPGCLRPGTRWQSSKTHAHGHLPPSLRKNQFGRTGTRLSLFSLTGQM